MSKTILHARVPTADQTLTHQKTQAEAAGFTIDEVAADHGVSGISHPAGRPHPRHAPVRPSALR